MNTEKHQVIQQQVTLTPEQKGQYIHVPFRVPAHIASVTMRVEYDYEFPKCVIQPALYDTAGIRGCCAVQKNSCKVLRVLRLEKLKKESGMFPYRWWFCRRRLQ